MVDLDLNIIIAISVVIITLIVFWLFKKSTKTSKKYFLLLGNSNAGKTAIFSRLVFKKPLQTQISIKENKNSFYLDKINKKVELIDVPGFGNIREKFIEQYKKLTKGIIFVIDSETFNKDSKDVALYLYDILTDDTLSTSRLPVIIACNKQDVELCKGQELIKTVLEREIEALRKTASATLESTTSSSKNDSKKYNILTKLTKPFEFSDVKKSINVEFCECSAIENKKSVDLQPITKWLETFA